LYRSIVVTMVTFHSYAWVAVWAALLSQARGFQSVAPKTIPPPTSATALLMAELYTSVNGKQLAWDENSGRFFELITDNGDGDATSTDDAVAAELSTEMEEPSSKLSQSSSNVEEYKNVATSVLANFMSEPKQTADNDSDNEDPLGNIDFDAPKLSQTLDMETWAAVLDAELIQREWFVTGNVNPTYYADSFRFEDPDVTLEGIENYARGVNKLFDQATSRAEIISTLRNPELGPTWITCTWRLSGYANIGPGIAIKPYIVYTDLRIDPESGLIDFQKDRFDIPSWDILLSAVFPFLIGKVTAPPAPPVEPREVVMPDLVGGKKTPLFDFDNLGESLNESFAAGFGKLFGQ